MNNWRDRFFARNKEIEVEIPERAFDHVARAARQLGWTVDDQCWAPVLHVFRLNRGNNELVLIQETYFGPEHETRLVLPRHRTHRAQRPVVKGCKILEKKNMFNPEDIPIFIENIVKVEPVFMCSGITRRTLSTGHQLMFCLFEWEAGAILPEHSHHHEQLGYVVSGKVEFTIGGRTIVLGPGESYAIPSNVVHSGKSYEPTRVLDAFSPIREEYL